MVFVSDSSGAIGKKYGVYLSRSTTMTIASPSSLSPDGKITYRAMPFKEMTEGAYGELGSAVASASHGTSAGTR